MNGALARVTVRVENVADVHGGWRLCLFDVVVQGRRRESQPRRDRLGPNCLYSSRRKLHGDECSPQAEAKAAMLLPRGSCLRGG